MILILVGIMNEVLSEQPSLGKYPAQRSAKGHEREWMCVSGSGIG